MPRPQLVLDFPVVQEARHPLCFSDPRTVLCASTPQEVRDVLREAERLARAGAWVAGYVAYEAAPAFDRAHRVPGGAGTIAPAWFAAFDAPMADAQLPPPATGPAEWRPAWDRDRYDRAIAQVRAAIARGDLYQVNLTMPLRAPFAGDDLAWFLALRAAQASEYCAYLDLGRHRIVSASPELFFRRDGTRLTARPMKGTAPRGRWGSEDDAAAEALHASAKDRAENVMIVDLLRNDLSRIARAHSVRVPELFRIERYPTLLQMTSMVTAQVREGEGLDAIFAALFPCGSVTGAPKIKAMEAIAALESDPREAYCGAIGVIAPGGDAVFSVAIRTVLLDAAAGMATCGVGGGVVWESTAGGEYEELRLKARFLTAPARRFALFETIRLEDGAYWLLERHLARLAGSARYFGFPFDEAACRAALAERAGAHGPGLARARLVLERDGALRVELAPFPVSASEPVEVALADAPVSSRDPFLFHKTTAREAYERAAASKPGAFDVLLWNEARQATEFTRGNLVVRLGERLVTPGVDCGLLDGTLRRQMLEAGEIEEGVVGLDDLARAEEIWFVNGLRGKLRARLRPIPARE